MTMTLRLRPHARGLPPCRHFAVAVARLAAVVALLCGGLGCHSIPEGARAVDRITIRGANKMDEDDVTDKITTTASPKFLGLVRGLLYDYSVFDRNVLQKDLERIEAFYRSKGYYDAHARAGRVHRVDDDLVRIEVIVEEGAPVLVRRITITGLDGIPKDDFAIARHAVTGTLEVGAPLDEEQFEKARNAVRRALADRGYAYAAVTNEATVDIVRHTVDVVLDASAGERCVFGAVKIVGLGELPEKPVRRALDIDPNEPFSEAAMEAAQQAVLDLGVFATVEIIPELPSPPRPDHVVPVTVKVEAARLRTVRLGGGIEFDALKADVHGLVGWENRNILGGMRSLNINLRPGLVLYPLRVNNIEFPKKFLPSASLWIEFRQPGFLEARTNLFVRNQPSIAPLLLDTNPPPGQPVLGYGEDRNAIGLDRAYGKAYGMISHNLQVAYPFAYVGERDPTLGTLVISYPELVIQLDLRNNRVHPRRGIWLANTFQVAGGPFFGQAEDVKVQPDVRGYIPLTRNTVLAMRGSVGFLFPRNYGENVEHPSSVFTQSVERTRDYQLTFFRGFFSGGPTTNRGYPLRGVGPHDFVPFISPEVATQRLARSCGGNFDCRVPTGGFTLWEASAELRWDIGGPLSFAGFCDASDVSPHPANLRFSHLHLSCGGGVRYDTPVGPIRLDLGYRIPGLQVIGGLTRDERKPDTFVFGIPIALWVGVGEAY